MKVFMISCILLCSVISIPYHFVEAQQNQSQPKLARKLDQYSYGSGSGMRVNNDCDVDAHLDNFAYFLKEESGSRGYMIFYRGKHKPSKYFAFNPKWQHSQLMFEWKFDEGKVLLIDGGYREEAMMELWIVPERTEAPVPSPTFPRKKKKR